MPARHGVEWNVDENLPVYTEDLLKIARLWSPDGENTLEHFIRDFADQLTGRLTEQLGKRERSNLDWYDQVREELRAWRAGTDTDPLTSSQRVAITRLIYLILRDEELIGDATDAATHSCSCHVKPERCYVCAAINCNYHESVGRKD